MNTERIKALVTAIVVFASTVANIYGFTVDVDAWVNVILCIINFVAIASGYWFNQNWTSEAQQAQAWLDHLKAEKKALKVKDVE